MPQRLHNHDKTNLEGRELLKVPGLSPHTRLTFGASTNLRMAHKQAGGRSSMSTFGSHCGLRAAMAPLQFSRPCTVPLTFIFEKLAVLKTIVKFGQVQLPAASGSQNHACVLCALECVQRHCSMIISRNSNHLTAATSLILRPLPQNSAFERSQRAYVTPLWMSDISSSIQVEDFTRGGS